MRRMLYESRMIHRPAADVERELLERGPELLARAAGSELWRDPADVDGSFSIDLPAHWAGLDLAKRVHVTIGVARRLDRRLILPLSWSGDHGRHLFPVFDGTLEVEALFRDVAELTLAGSYRVPLGPVGAALDAAVLHAAARDTTARLVQELAAALAGDHEDVDEPAPRVEEHDPRLRVRHVMTPDPLVVAPETGLRAAARALLAAGISAVPVVAADGGLVGVLSEHDLLAKEARPRFALGRRAHAEADRREADTAGEACSKPAMVTAPETPLTEVARAMLDHGVNRLVVVDQGAIVGIVSRRDVLRALVRDSDDLFAAVRSALDSLGAQDAQARVDDDGIAWISGRVRLRSVAAQVHDVVAAVEGVIGVRTDGLDYAEDDVLPAMPIM